MLCFRYSNRILATNFVFKSTPAPRSHCTPTASFRWRTLELCRPIHLTNRRWWKYSSNRRLTWTYGTKPIKDKFFERNNIQIKCFPQRRPIGCDLEKGEPLFVHPSHYPGNVTYDSILASVGKLSLVDAPQIGVVSTGDELVAPGQPLAAGKIYDSNMTMLVGLLRQFGFDRVKTVRAKDE